MNKKKSKNYVTGALILAAGSLLSKVLGMFFKIPLTNILGDYGMGLYGYAYPLYSTFLMMSTAGLPSAVSKMVSESVSKNNYKQAYKIFYIAFVTLALLGIVVSCSMFAGAHTFIKIFSWDENAYYSIVAISFAPFFVCLCSVVRGFFQGMQNMKYTSISQVLEQIGRVVAGVSLAIYLLNSRGVAWGAAGATFGAVAGAVISFVFLYISFGIYRSKHKIELANHADSPKVADGKIIFKTLLSIAIPIALSSIITTQMDLINSVTISDNLQKIGYSLKEATDMYGQLTSKAQTLVNVPLTIGASLSASLVPSISESLIGKDISKARKKATLAVKLSLLIAVPAALGLSILSEPIIKLLFSKAYEGYEMLSVLSFSLIFTVLMSSLQGILHGSGKYYLPLINMAIGGIIKLILNNALVRVPELNIYGAILSTIIASFVIAVLNYLSVKKHLGFDRLFLSICKIILTSSIMAVVCKMSYSLLLNLMSFKIAVLIAIFISVIVYGVMIIITKAITLEELRSVRS